MTHAEFEQDDFKQLLVAGNLAIRLYKTPDGEIFSSREDAFCYLYNQLKNSLQDAPKKDPIEKKIPPVKENSVSRKKGYWQDRYWDLAERGITLSDIVEITGKIRGNVQTALNNELSKRGLKTFPETFNLYGNIGENLTRPKGKRNTNQATTNGIWAK